MLDHHEYSTDEPSRWFTEALWSEHCLHDVSDTCARFPGASLPASMDAHIGVHLPDGDPVHSR